MGSFLTIIVYLSSMAQLMSVSTYFCSACWGLPVDDLDLAHVDGLLNLYTTTRTESLQKLS